MPSLRCPACSRPLSLPLPALCPECASPTDRPPVPPPREPGGVPLIVGTTDDDGNPYTVIGDKPAARCPECNAKLPAENVPNCDRCGWDRAAGKRLPKTYPPINRSWEAGWTLRTRLVVFVICQALNVATAVLVYFHDGRAVTSAGGFVVAVLTQAFILGTFDRLDMGRTTKGKVTLSLQWRLAFVPLPARVVRWREHEDMRMIEVETSWLELLVFLQMFLSGALLLVFALQPMLFVMAVLWWWYVIRPGHVKLALCQNLGDPVMPLYLGTSREQAEEIAEEVSAVTGITWRPHGA